MIKPVIKLKPVTKRCKDKIHQFGEFFQIMEGPKSISAIAGKVCVLLRPTRIAELEDDEPNRFWIEHEYCEHFFG